MRKTVFWVHLFLALVAGVVIALLSLTGALLAFEKQTVAWADPHVVVPADGRGMLSIDAQARRAIEVDPAFVSSTVTLFAKPTAPTLFVGGQARVFIDPYTGQSLGEGSTTARAVFRWITQMHRWLTLTGDARPAGRWITGAANLVFVLVLATGLFIWFPKTFRWRNFKTVLFPRFDLRGKARDWNWHHAVGIWSLLPLVAMSVTGLVISYTWAGNLLAWSTGGAATSSTTRPAASPTSSPTSTPTSSPTSVPAALAGDPLDGLDRVVLAARGQTPGWTRLSFKLPADQLTAVGVTVDVGTGAQPQHKTTLTIARDGQIRSAEPFGSLAPSRQARSIARFLHTGELLGLVGQFVFGLACVAAVVLTWTGFALSWRRFARKRKGVAG